MTACGCPGRHMTVALVHPRYIPSLPTISSVWTLERHWRHELPPNHWNERFAMDDKLRRHFSSGSAPGPPACEYWVGCQHCGHVWRMLLSASYRHKAVSVSNKHCAHAMYIYGENTHDWNIMFHIFPIQSNHLLSCSPVAVPLLACCSMKNCCNFWRHASSQESVRRVYV